MAKCPVCFSERGFIELHGSSVCLNCKNKIASCCGDEGCVI